MTGAQRQGSKICFYGKKTLSGFFTIRNDLVSVSALNPSIMQSAIVMARPRKPPEERRSEIVRFAVRPAEYTLIRNAAKAARMTLSEYGRSMCLRGKVTIQKTRALDPETYDQLRRIGVNLNQAVHKFHATGEPPLELINAARAVETFIADRLDDGS